VREFRGAVKSPEELAAEEAAKAPAQPAVAAPAAPPAVAPAAPAVPAAPAAVAENKCQSCAMDNPPGQTFCGQCGSKLTRAA
jgi:hypothetical protein